MNYYPLEPHEEQVILHKGTETPFIGIYYNFFEDGTYLCRQCGMDLFRSKDKFSCSCGWPAFDDSIEGAVKSQPDADGRRTEIVCAACSGHLGHVFTGENLTPKNTRHCVNSISLLFMPAEGQARAYFAGGCFWGVEYLFEKKEGVISAISGYMGGTQENPSYEDVIYRNTGHLETVEITYDPKKVSYETLARFFFEIHDPTQKNGQGPDIGEQYLSAVFVRNEYEKKTVQKLIRILKHKGFDAATQIRPLCPFYKAEDYHQEYYEKTGKVPYCHVYKQKF